MAKEIIKEYFVCISCGHTQFSKEYTFSIEFHPVNFSDNLIYGKEREEIYVCKECSHKVSYKEIKQGLREIKAKYKYIDKGNGDV
ncbi:hypothetical protein LCGC14_0855390 [marine sediment metagenome]|uniref:Uncharacterized protein n=1 Tax=marine sediment metagenome TaxID=412755 RepID=A0A0F9SG26_9ZZZZ